MGRNNGRNNTSKGPKANVRSSHVNRPIESTADPSSRCPESGPSQQPKSSRSGVTKGQKSNGTPSKDKNGNNISVLGNTGAGRKQQRQCSSKCQQPETKPFRFCPNKVEYHAHAKDYELGVAVIRNFFTGKECDLLQMTCDLPGAIEINDRHDELNFRHTRKGAILNAHPQN